MDIVDELVSIIVPVYNVEKYLSDCIKSVLIQTYANFELLLVNDGSTDNSKAICEEYLVKDNRVRIFDKINGGLSSARNYGIEKAVGKYIIFLDSDDYWLTADCLEKLVKVAEDFKTDVVRGEYKEVDEVGKDLLLKDFSYKLDKQMQILPSSDFYKWIINGENFSVLFLFKRELFESGLRYNEKRHFQEDIELNIRLYCKDLRCVYIPIVFYAYRKRRYSIVNTYNVVHLHDSFLLSDVFDKYYYIAHDSQIKKLYRYNSIMMYYWTLGTLSQEPYYKDHIDIIKKLSLVDINKKVRVWANSTKKIYPLPIYISPLFGIYYFRLRFKIGRLLRMLRLR